MYPEPKNTPWGNVQTCKELCNGVFDVGTEHNGGIMVVISQVDSLLPPAAQECGFKENGYLCFEDGSSADVVMRELLDKKLWAMPSDIADKAAFEKSINEPIMLYHPAYWQDREQRLAERITPLKQQLVDRLDKNLADYHAHIMGFDKRSIIEMADRISTVADAHTYAVEHFSFDDEDNVRYLLQFQNPLEVIADGVEQQRQDISDIGFIMWSIFDRRDAEKDYPLMTDPPTQPVTLEKAGKQSLLEQISENAKKLKARDAATPDASQSRKDKETRS